MVRRLVALVAAALALVLACAPSAFAHAQLVGTEPARGAVVPTQPKVVEFRFSESVEGKLGAVRVFDARSARVDNGEVEHPGGDGSKLEVGLKPGLPDGSYTATYRIVSADGHPVSGGLVFSIGKAGAGPSKSVDELIGASKAGPVTKAASRVAQGLEYLATALAVGMIAFLLLCLRPALARSAGASGSWREATEALADRSGYVLLGVVNLGIAAGVAAIVLEAAIASGNDLWGALDATLVRDVLQTRFGEVWGLRTVVWVLLGGVLLAGLPRRATALRPATLGAEGQALAPLTGVPLAALIVPVGLLVVAPALEGHQSSLGPLRLMQGLDIVHVGAMSVWIGGIAALLLLVPVATARLEPADRTRLLSAAVLRFSPLALASVVALAITGAIASIEYLTSFSQLLDTSYGREILIKSALLLVLVGFGAMNRQRLLPQLKAAADGGAAPGTAGRTLRTTLRAEAALLVSVLAVTALLVDGVPPVSAAGGGPVSISKTLGPLDLELTVDPASPGANEMHVYLFRRSDGAPFTGTKELTVTATLPSKAIGPLPVTLRRTGPGHWTADTLQLAPGGTWKLTVTDRYTDFDEVSTSVSVPIR